MDNETTTIIAPSAVTLRQAIADQSFQGGWVCPQCKNYKGGVSCKKNVFIAFAGAYLKDCFVYDQNI